MFVTFLSDFGLRDDFVGTCHGVMKRIAPELQIVDITHGIPARAIVQGALVLANTVPYMPHGVHLAVVDPGVGGPRRALALRDSEGRLYVGPDNGLLLPAAAHLARGLALEELGPPIDPGALVRLELPHAELRPNRITATALYVDAFGNVQLNLTKEHLGEAGVQPGKRVELELAGQRYFAIAARTFSDARTGDLILYEDSYGNVAVAMNGGNAAEMLGARAGQDVRINLDVP
jgi:S-adenosylmethionine hydrolase